jgi:hypothetical protein
MEASTKECLKTISESDLAKWRTKVGPTTKVTGGTIGEKAPGPCSTQMAANSLAPFEETKKSRVCCISRMELCDEKPTLTVNCNGANF